MPQPLLVLAHPKDGSTAASASVGGSNPSVVGTVDAAEAQAPGPLTHATPVISPLAAAVPAVADIAICVEMLPVLLLKL